MPGLHPGFCAHGFILCRDRARAHSHTMCSHTHRSRRREPHTRVYARGVDGRCSRGVLRRVQGPGARRYEGLDGRGVLGEGAFEFVRETSWWGGDAESGFFVV